MLSKKCWSCEHGKSGSCCYNMKREAEEEGLKLEDLVTENHCEYYDDKKTYWHEYNEED